MLLGCGSFLFKLCGNLTNKKPKKGDCDHS